MTIRLHPSPLLLGAILIAGCSDDLSKQLPTSPKASVGPLCQLGCTETDPNPSAPGVFLGSGVTPGVCFNGTQTDADQDGLGDFCEKNLAAAFAPDLRYTPGDDIRREPHWAARFTATDEQVSIAYLLSYYRDTGSKGFEPGLGAHNGDSESIGLRVYYNYSTKHWVLQSATYSQHGNYHVYDRGAAPYPYVLQYLGHPGSYPRSWVSEGKHANYAYQSECNAGGTLDNDTCEDNTADVRVEAGTPLNVGSRQHHLLDCMPSNNPSYEFYGAGRIECYWTLVLFRGWVPDSVGGGDSGTAYTDVLSVFGF